MSVPFLEFSTSDSQSGFPKSKKINERRYNTIRTGSCSGRIFANQLNYTFLSYESFLAIIDTFLVSHDFIVEIPYDFHSKNFQACVTLQC